MLRRGMLLMRAAPSLCLSTSIHREISSSSSKGRLVVALGGNVLLRRGEKMTMDNQRQNARAAMSHLAELCKNYQVTLVHGNGPQIGLLAMQTAAFAKDDYSLRQPLDILDAETEGMIGYMLEQELENALHQSDKTVATLLTQTVVDENDAAFDSPSKFVGPVLDESEADRLKKGGLQVKRDGKYWRRVVPSPRPMRIIEQELRAIRLLAENGAVVICGGGGGIPVVYDSNTETLSGIEAVVDKDHVARLLASSLDADGLMVLTDVEGVAVGFGTPGERWIKSASPASLDAHEFSAGSMGPKVEACCDFVTQNPGRWAAIGSLTDAIGVLEGTRGTHISASGELEWY